MRFPLAYWQDLSLPIAGYSLYTWVQKRACKSEGYHWIGSRYEGLFVWLVGWYLVNYNVISQTGPKTERLTILRAATHETELGDHDHDFCLSRSHYTDTVPTSRERAATAGIEPGTSSPGVAPPPLPPGVDMREGKRTKILIYRVYHTFILLV